MLRAPSINVIDPISLPHARAGWPSLHRDRVDRPCHEVMQKDVPDCGDAGQMQVLKAHLDGKLQHMDLIHRLPLGTSASLWVEKSLVSKSETVKAHEVVAP
jgi:hypothetical protein